MHHLYSQPEFAFQTRIPGPLTAADSTEADHSHILCLIAIKTNPARWHRVSNSH